jgi:lipopolysaccharide biosynthesis glycosyltransferase
VAGQPSQRSDCAIALCADAKYFPPAYALALSLVRQQTKPHDVYLLTEPGPHLDRVPGDVPFTVLTPDFADRIPIIPGLVHNFTSFGFLRLFLAELLEGYRRILYLDCDVRVDGPLQPLFDIDLKGAAFAAVDDVLTFYPPLLAKQIPHRAALGIANEPYFNSGVLLVDAERWKRARMGSVAIECLARLGTLVKMPDQDALNVAFCKQWLPLSPRWNFPFHAYESDIEALIKPVVRHHLQQKPWVRHQIVPKRERRHFRAAMQDTPFRDFVESTAHQHKRWIEWRLKRFLQDATFFLPASQQRIQERDDWHSYRAMGGPSLAAFILDNVRSGRFADVDQGISTIDIGKLVALTRSQISAA